MGLILAITLSMVSTNASSTAPPLVRALSLMESIERQYLPVLLSGNKWREMASGATSFSSFAASLWPRCDSRESAFVRGRCLAVAARAPGHADEPSTVLFSSQKPSSDSQRERLSPEQRAARRQLAREYMHGYYWLYFIEQGYTFLMLSLILMTGLSARLRRWAQRMSRRATGATLIYGLLFISVWAALGFPLEAYRFWRERRYGFATQDVWSWMGDEGKGLAVALILGSLAILAVYTAIRKAPRRWWLWASGVLIGWMIVIFAIAPVFIAPLFNTFRPLEDESLRQRILALAHEQGIPADDVYQADASRQSRHTNAYVAGLWRTQRIVLYDTLIEHFTPEEVEFIMGHEMGHYVLHHVWKGIALASVLIVIGLWIMSRLAPRLIRRYYRRWKFREVSDVASLPVLLLLGSLYAFLLNPVINGFSRHLEREADLFGLRVAPHPEAAITAFEKFEIIDLSEADPPPFIEFWLYTHPSLHHRIETVKAFLAEKERSLTGDGGSSRGR